MLRVLIILSDILFIWYNHSARTSQILFLLQRITNMKTEFSSQLERLIKSQKKTLRYLAEASGLQLDYISKMSKGKRLPQEEEKVLRLLDALECTSGKKTELLNLYRKEKLGTFRWNCMEELIRIIEQETSDSLPPREAVQHGIWQTGTCLSGAVFTKKEVFSCINWMLSGSSEQTLYLWTPEISQLDLEQLLNLLLKSPFPPVEHLLPLWQNREEEDTLKNLNTIRSIKPAFLHPEYQPYFYYLQNTGETHISLFPNWIISGKNALGINSSLEQAIILKEPSQLELLKHEFQKKRQMASALIVRMDLFDYLQNVNQMMNSGYITRHYYIEPSPCLLHLIPLSVLQKHLKGDIEKKKLLMSFLQLRTSHMENEEMVHIFSMEGLRILMEKGRIAEYPDDLYEPLEMPMRVWLLKRYYQFMENSSERACICVKENDIHLPHHISIVCSSNVNNGISFWSNTSSGLQYCLIREAGISQMLYQFCQFLESGGFSYSRDETLSLLRQMILKYGGSL